MADNKDEKQYLLDKHPEEEERLALAQEVMVDSMGKAVWAPIDLTQPGLKILDSGTGAGKTKFFLFLFFWKYPFYLKSPRVIPSRSVAQGFRKDTPSRVKKYLCGN